MSKALVPLILLTIVHPLLGQDTELIEGEFDFRELVGLLPALVVLILYLVPTFIAHIRDAEAYGKIFLLNVLLGWTVIGWLAALIWSLRAKPFFPRRPFPVVLIVSAVCLLVVLITAYLQVQGHWVLILR